MELKNKIKVDSSKHWKISKGGVTSVDTEDPSPEVIPEVEDAPSNSQEPPLDAPNGEPSEGEKPREGEETKELQFQTLYRFMLHHSDYESN